MTKLFQMQNNKEESSQSLFQAPPTCRLGGSGPVASGFQPGKKISAFESWSTALFFGTHLSDVNSPQLIQFNIEWIGTDQSPNFCQIRIYFISQVQLGVSRDQDKIQETPIRSEKEFHPGIPHLHSEEELLSGGYMSIVLRTRVTKNNPEKLLPRNTIVFR